MLGQEQGQYTHNSEQKVQGELRPKQQIKPVTL